MYALSIGIKISYLGWPWMAKTHSWGKNLFTEPTRKIWVKINPNCQQQNVG